MASMSRSAHHNGGHEMAAKKRRRTGREGDGSTRGGLRMAIPLSFDVTKCLKCHGDRLLGGPCPECGTAGRPGEVNSAVVRRTSRVRQVEHLLQRRPDEGAGVAPMGAVKREELAEFGVEFLRGLAALGSGELPTSGVAETEAAVRRLEEFRARARATGVLRPHVAASRAIGLVLTELESLWPLYSAALTATSLHEAQVRGQKAQVVVENAFSALDEFEAMEHVSAALQDPGHGDFIDRTLLAVSRLYPGTSLLELAPIGAEEASRSTGEDVDPANGAQFLLLRAAGRAVLDPEKLEASMGSALRLCNSSEHLATVAAMPGALPSLAASLRAVYEGFSAFEAVLHSGPSDEAVIRRVVLFYGETLEGVGGALFAWFALLAGLKSQQYEKLVRDNDATQLLRRLSDSEATEALFRDVKPHLRHAAQHGGAFEVDGEVIHFNLRSWSGSMTWGELANDMFALLEALAATSWALSTSLTGAGIEIPDVPGSVAQQGSFRFARQWIEQQPCGLLDSEDNGGVWRFVIADRSANRANLAYALAMGSDPKLRSVTVQVEGATTAFEIALSEVEAYLEAGERRDEDQGLWLIALLKLRLAARNGKESMLRSSDLLYVASLAGVYLLADHPQWIPVLREVKRMAVETGLTEAVDVVHDIFRAYRSDDIEVRRPVATAVNKRVQEGAYPLEPDAESVTCVK